jgi:hypothetical protein
MQRIPLDSKEIAQKFGATIRFLATDFSKHCIGPSYQLGHPRHRIELYIRHPGQKRWRRVMITLQQPGDRLAGCFISGGLKNTPIPPGHHGFLISHLD